MTPAITMVVSSLILFIMSASMSKHLFIQFIMVLSGLTLLMIGIIIIIIYWNDWRKIRDDGHPVISFKQFISCYEIIPENWELNDDCVYYRGTRQYVDFKTYYDYSKYQRFIKNKEKLEQNKKKMDDQIRFVKSLQRDINQQYKEITDFLHEKGEL